MDPEPLDPVHFGQFPEQFGQGTAAVQVQAVIGRVLGDQHELTDALGGQRTGFGDQILHRHGTVRTADVRNRTVGAAAVAAFRDLQEGVRTPPADTAADRAALRQDRAAQGTDEGIQVPCAEPAVHLGNQPGQLVHIPLGQAAEHEDLPGQAALLAVHRLEDGLDGLFLGIADEAAGIQQQVIGIPVRVVLRQQGIGIPHLGEQVLGVDLVLGAAEGDDLQGGHQACSAAAASRSSSVRNSSEAKFFSSLYQSTTFFMWET